MMAYETKAPPADIETGRSSDRAFGFIVGGIFAAVALVRWSLTGFGEPGLLTATLAILAVPLLVLALVAPAALAPANRAWMALGVVLARIVNPIVLGLIFIVAVIPTALVMRALGKRPLRLARDDSATTYWIDRNAGEPSPLSMKEQF